MMQHIQYVFDGIRSKVLGAYCDTHLWACNIKPVAGCWRLCLSATKQEGWQVLMDPRYSSYWCVQYVPTVSRIYHDIF